MGEWKEYKLGEIIKIVGGGTPKTSECRYWNGNIPWLSVVDFNNDRKYVYETEKHISVEGLNNSSTKILSKGDIIISARGTVGAMAMLGKDMAFNQSCYGIQPTKLVDRDYLYYLLFSSIQELKHNSHGGVFDTITRDTFDTIEILLPSLKEQKRIASILSSLDDKIDLLHQENKTLEAMAETLFRKWFIEDAKEEWEKGLLENLIIIKYGKDHKVLDDGNIPVLGSGGIMRYANKAIYSKESVLIPRKGTLNNVLYINEPFWTVDTMFYTEMKKNNIAKFVYLFIKTIDLESMNVGSAVPSLTVQELNNIPLNIPEQEYFDAFENITNPLFTKIKNNNKQIKNLSITRDSILHKLMSKAE
jgi:type I restriction enzyme S subunit